MRKLQYGIREIARELHRSHSTISRELKRNGNKLDRNVSYYTQAEIAHTEAVKRRSIASRGKMRLKCDPIRHYVELHLREARWTPATIAGALGRHGYRISAEAIYQFINYERPELKSSLWVAGRSRRRRCAGKQHRFRQRQQAAAPKRSIESLPQAARERLEIGHFELDAMLGKRGTGAIQNKTDRRYRRMFLDKATNLESEPYADLLISRFRRDIPNGVIKTILQDNGVEHAEHPRVDKELNVENYFCHPYCASERGTVENRNGVLRRFIPKGSDLTDLQPEYLEWVEDYFNNMPMEILGFKTPNQVWNEELANP